MATQTHVMVSFSKLENGKLTSVLLQWFFSPVG